MRTCALGTRSWQEIKKGLLPTQAILGKHLLASELRAQHSSNKDLFLVISRGLTLGLGGHQWWASWHWLLWFRTTAVASQMSPASASTQNAPFPHLPLKSTLCCMSYIFITRGKFTLTLETRPTFLKDSVSMGYTREMALDQKSGLQSCIALGL